MRKILYTAQCVGVVKFVAKFNARNNRWCSSALPWYAKLFIKIVVNMCYNFYFHNKNLSDTYYTINAQKNQKITINKAILSIEKAVTSLATAFLVFIDT